MNAYLNLSPYVSMLMLLLALVIVNFGLLLMELTAAVQNYTE